MKINLVFLFTFSFFIYSNHSTIAQVGEKIPNYTFTEILNTDQKPFNLNNINKPVIIEFWATWCSPCIPAMSKLEDLQEKFSDKIEIITVSTDSKKNLNRYIKNSNTTLRIAFDTTHHDLFKYKYIPHTYLVDKNGIIKAITTPDKITESKIKDLIEGKDFAIKEIDRKTANIFNINIEFTNSEYQFSITSENKNYSFRNDITRNDNEEPTALDFRNVSIIRLMTDVYELTSAARIINIREYINENKYCFQLEQSNSYKKDVLEHAKEILNSNIDVKAKLVTKEIDSLYVLEIIDKKRLPKKSIEKENYYEFRGPYYLGKKITSYNLIEYLENEVQKPIKDKTNLDYTFDIELDWSYGDKKSLNNELEKYGLRVNKSSKPEKITLLELYE